MQEISFILTDNSERNNVKLNRIGKRAVSAMKQSLKAYLPQIKNIVPIKDFMKICGNSEKYIPLRSNLFSSKIDFVLKFICLLNLHS